MKKAELIAIAEKYGMEFIRQEITREGCGVFYRSEEPVPELDHIVEETGKLRSETAPVFGRCSHPCEGTPYDYQIFCPKSWIDLWGWV